MTRCITWSTGRRPHTALTAYNAMRLQCEVRADELVVGRWADGAPSIPVPMLEVPGGSRAEVHNSALEYWRMKHEGDIPDVWFAVDDDIVPCQNMFDRMEAVLEADPEIFLLGAWNDGSQRQENGVPWGWEALKAGEVIQYGNDFNVGGAVQAIPKRAIEKVGVYDPKMVWLEDHDYTQRVRATGKQAAIARTIFAVVLKDDGDDPNYRAEMTDTFFAKRKEILGW